MSMTVLSSQKRGPMTTSMTRPLRRPKAGANLTIPTGACKPARAHGESACCRCECGRPVDQWTPRIEAAKTPEEKAQLKQTANGELVQAIQKPGTGAGVIAGTQAGWHNARRSLSSCLVIASGAKQSSPHRRGAARLA